MKNLVMGVAKSYGWSDLEPFVVSCKKNCPSAELVLFVDDISDFTRDKMLRGGVKLENFPDELRSGIPNNTRWKIFADYLDAQDDFAQVFVTDTRDVIFQGDVFVPFNEQKNFLGYTTEKNFIGNDKTYNYRWLVTCFGKEEADKLADKKIICCGTIVGSVDAMKIFCGEMWKILEHKPDDIFDQAVMNYLVWNKLLPIKNLIEIDVHDGEIYTNGLIKDNKILGDKILRGDGGVPSVVHQYDRHDNLVKLVDEIYRDKNFQADERFNDAHSVLDQINYLLFGGKVDDAARLCMKTSAGNKNFGANMNLPIKIWERILNKPFTPAAAYLELIVQSFCRSVQNFPFQNLYQICRLLTHSIKNRRAVDPGFLNIIANALMKLAEQGLKIKAAEQCFFCIETLNSFDLPMNKDFYFFLSEVNRTFGRKEEALAAYKKALDLN